MKRKNAESQKGIVKYVGYCIQNIQSRCKDGGKTEWVWGRENAKGEKQGKKKIKRHLITKQMTK